MDERAQGAISIARIFLALGVGAIAIWILNEVATPILNMAGEQSSDPVATAGNSYLSAGVEFVPALFLFITFFGTIAGAVYYREVVR
jgi:Na+-driven multidrug efflux pump